MAQLRLIRLVEIMAFALILCYIWFNIGRGECVNNDDVNTLTQSLLYNPLEPTTLFQHHVVFSQFTRWRGSFDPEYVTDWLGIRTRYAWDCIDDPLATMHYSLVQPSRRIPCEIHDMMHEAGYNYFAGGMPIVDDEYEEYVDVLQAVVQTSREFVMVELGARYGVWGVRALKAWHQLRGQDARATFVGVESDGTYFEWMQEHVARNNLTHESVLIRAMAGKEGAGMDLWSIAKKAGIDHIDYLDADIQGSEGEFFDDPTTMAYVDTFVHVVHIGTHSEVVHRRVDQLFQQRRGWEQVLGYNIGYGRDCDKTLVKALQTNPKCTVASPYGRVYIRDGMLSFRNVGLLKH